ncbi:unnamed protein product [Effrenium voratum]|uniref:K Homology domain-containing protein n=1 Tax=Effrenium voratum TaxID=2562239 RepID=A0AA36IGJ0_9DINO|nr:unnamed protein product [Effrenium voratum]
MKRGYDEGPGRERARERFGLKALVPDTFASFLLRERGVAKEELQQESGARVIFSNKGDFFPGTALRVLGVYADAPENVLRGLELVMSRMQELAEDDQRLRQPPPGCEMLGDEGELIFRVLLSRDLTGLLIGNAGANIKELRRESGAKIVVRDDSVVGHRLATLSGSHESLAEALRRITELMEREADREEFQHYLRLINFGESEGAEPSGKGRHRPSPVEAEGFDGMRHLQQDLDSMPPGTSELSYSVCCALPASLVPALIGRSGDFVRSIEERTGAKVDIAREARGKDGYRKMECVGPLASIYAAHTLMMHRLQEVERAPERPARRPVPRHSGWSSANAAPLAPTATEKSQAEKQQDLRATIAELERKLLAARAV